MVERARQAGSIKSEVQRKDTPTDVSADRNWLIRDTGYLYHVLILRCQNLFLCEYEALWNTVSS